MGRVIARPFVGKSGSYKRTGNRKDFSLSPTGETVLDALTAHGLEVLSIGKIRDIFAGRGIADCILTHSNGEGMDALTELQKKPFCGLCFANLVDFDMLYGHRNDIDGYARALSEFDAWLPTFLAGMEEDDLLVVTADHGCDPGDVSTDHTRENVPLLIFGKGVRPVDLGVRHSFSDVAATVADIFDVPYQTHGISLKENIL